MVRTGSFFTIGDISLDSSALECSLADLGDGVRYMSANEYCGYLHARVERDNEAQPFAMAVTYDDHYCRHFASHESTWILHLADETRRNWKTTVPERQTITIQKAGRHLVPAGSPLR